MADRVEGYRKIWVDHYGSIPEGHVIHHINGDHYNDDISNLECITRSEHYYRHAELRRKYPELETLRPIRIRRSKPRPKQRVFGLREEDYDWYLTSKYPRILRKDYRISAENFLKLVEEERGNK